MSFMPSELLPARSTVIESNESVEVKINKFPSTSPPSVAPASKFNAPDAIFSIVPINTDNYGSYGKPNAIVRPVRRNEPTEMTLPQANEARVPASDHSSPKVNVPAKNKKPEIDTFTKELENKLKHLQKDKKSSTGNAIGGSDPIANRPRFFTTVPSGVYLPPAKEPPAPKLRHPRTYAYFSIPKIFAQNIDKGNKESPIEQIHAIKTMTTYDKMGKLREPQTQPQNIMYDKRVVRGSNYSHMHLQPWNPYFAYAGLLSGKGDNDAVTKESEAERRQLLRKRYSNRSKRSVIGTPPPVKGRRHEMIQTERYLEEIMIKPSDYSVECQTDLYLYDVPNAPYISTKVGVDVATETDADELYNFDDEVQPILDALIEMTMKQALNEFMQEEEMAELQKDTEKYIAFKESQSSKSKRLDTEHEIMEQTMKPELISPTDDEITAAKLLHKYVSTLLPDVLSSVDAEINKKHILNTDDNFQPWLANEIASEVGQMIDSRDSLEKLVKNIVENHAGTYLKQGN